MSRRPEYNHEDDMIAHIDRLRAELAEHKGCATARVALYEAIRELDKAEAAIARVRALCEATPDLVEFRCVMPGLVTTAQVLAAIEGEQP